MLDNDTLVPGEDFDFKVEISEPIKEAKDDEKKKAEEERALFLRDRKKRKIKTTDITELLKNNVVEVVFKRRIWPIKFPMPGQQTEYRRMMATANWDWLNKNKKIFKFVPPKGIRPRPKNWYKKKGLVIVHDIIRADWRMISIDDYDIIKAVSIKNEEQQMKFVKQYRALVKQFGEKKLISFFNK